MRVPSSIVRAALLAVGILGLIVGPRSVSADDWPSYAGGPFHRAISPFASQVPQAILWLTPVDLNPVVFGGDLNAHYGSPIITKNNTIILPVKVGPDDTFRLEGHSGTNGALIWQLASDYVQPPHDWTLPFPVTLAGSVVVMPGAGGTVIVRSRPDQATGTTNRLAFYGIDNYNSNPAGYNAAVQICTPITADSNNNLYFGFLANGAPGNLQSGLACVSLNGSGTWIAAANAANDQTMQKVAYNCSPAISPDGSKVYVAVNNFNGFTNGAVGYLVAVTTGTLAPVAAVRLKDVAHPQNDALFFDDATSSPTVGTDGDVYYGVLENPFPFNSRPRLAPAFRRQSGNHQDSRRLRLGHHGLDGPVQRGPFVSRQVLLPDSDEVQRLRGVGRKRSESARRPGPQQRRGRSDLGSECHEAHPHDRRSDSRPEQPHSGNSQRSTRVVHQHCGDRYSQQVRHRQ